MFSYIVLSIEWIFYFERLYFLSVRTDVEPVNKDGVSGHATRLMSHVIFLRMRQKYSGLLVGNHASYCAFTLPTGYGPRNPQRLNRRKFKTAE